MQWHNALEPVFRVELGEEAEQLTFEREHQLSSKPLEIDLLLIKKEPRVQIQKNIGRIFREHNIVEYKSPTDYISINDFYKVYGYACQYQADTEKVNEISSSEITLTFLSKNYPDKMIRHVKKKRNMHIKRVEKGIYYLEGDEFPIQVLVTKQLSKEANYWLSCLRDDLSSKGEIKEFMEKYGSEMQNKWYQDLADTILRGNLDSEKEEHEMCDILRELYEEHFSEMYEKELAEAERKGEARGMARGEELGEELGEIRGMARAIVLDNLESGASKEVILRKLQRFLNIDEAAAEQYYAQNTRDIVILKHGRVE